MGNLLLYANTTNGIDCSSATATADDILLHKTAGTAEADDIIAGTMPDNSGWTGKIGVDETVWIPKGYHDGSGHVDQSIVNKGAWTYRLGVNGKALIPAGYHNGSGYIDQNIPTLSGQSITPSTGTQTIYTAGKYVTGNVVVNPIPNQRNAGTKGVGRGINSLGLYYYIPVGNYLPDGSGNSWVYMTLAEIAATLGITPGKIKKGETICGVAGTWSGFVPGNGDIYINGALGLATGFSPIMYMLQGSGVNWITGVRCNILYETGMIRLYGGYWNSIRTNNMINLSGWSAINVEAIASRTRNAKIVISTSAIDAITSSSAGDPGIEKYVNGSISTTKKTLSLDVTNINGNRYIAFGSACSSDFNENSYIYRIWLS